MAYIFFSYDKVNKHRKIVRMHKHRNHEIYYLVNGTTKYVVGDEIFNVVKGDVVIIPKDTFHTTDSEECMHNERFLLSFNDDLFDEQTACLLEHLLSHRLVHIPDNRREEFERILHAIGRHYDRENPVGMATVKIHILELVSFIYHYSTEAVVKISESDKVVHEISEYINRHYGEELALDKLGRKFSISESHLSRKFKSVAGVGIKEYITFVRIMNAEQILRTEDVSITEVAARCGFNDSNYFSAVFKKVKGITPLKFAKLVKESSRSEVKHTRF
ncbi:MAG: helix-turn-helix domain-containing protein [Clostridia bacterium]|nr:helix-turn-helix domain-containing protein [Clostridia bacterium]